MLPEMLQAEQRTVEQQEVVWGVYVTAALLAIFSSQDTSEHLSQALAQAAALRRNVALAAVQICYHSNGEKHTYDD